MIDSETKTTTERMIDAALETISADLDRPLPSASQIQIEIEELEKMFTDFNIDFKE